MNEVMAHNDEVVPTVLHRACTINDFCRLCANLDDNMVPIYADEGADHLLENKIRTHLPFINISKNDLLPKRICYHCASAVLVWNELYESSSVADQKLRNMFPSSPYDQSDLKSVPYDVDDIEGIHVPVKNFIGESIEYEEITDVNIFNKNDKSDKILSELDKIPSTSNAQNVLNHQLKPSEEVIQEDERLNPTLKSEMCDMFGRSGEDDGDSEDHNMYLNAAGMDDDINGLMNCHRLDDIQDQDQVQAQDQDHDEDLQDHQDSCAELLVPKQEYEELDDETTKGVEDDVATAGDCGDDQLLLLQNGRNVSSDEGIVNSTNCTEYDIDDRDLKPQLINMLVVKDENMGSTGDEEDHNNDEDDDGGGGGGGSVVEEEEEEEEENDMDDDDDDDGMVVNTSQISVRQLYVHGSDGTATDDEDGGGGGGGGDSAGGKSQETLCQICATVFKTRYNLLRHFQKRHPEYKMYECDLCRINFPSIDEFKDHLEEKHSKDSSNAAHAMDAKQVRFACDVCGNMYKNKASAMNHLLTHTAKKTVQCSLCDFTCYTKQQLGVHQTKHDKRFRCNICNKRFAQKSQLDVHVKAVHYNQRPYVCALCKKTFKTKGSHDAHMIVHTDTRNYQCPHCDKKCRKRYDLTLHIRTHTGEKPFKCSVCGRGFVQMCDTRKHEMLHFKPGKRKNALCSPTETAGAGVVDDE